jgi:hypothetical protein
MHEIVSSPFTVCNLQEPASCQYSEQIHRGIHTDEVVLLCNHKQVTETDEGIVLGKDIVCPYSFQATLRVLVDA